MTKQVQIRRGTDSQHTSFTGAEGEISVNTTNDSVHVHDGTTAGGKEMARADGSNVAFTSGTIDGAVIGGTTPAAGTFTTGDFNTSLNVDGTITSDGLTVDGSTILDVGDEGTLQIGATTTIADENQTIEMRGSNGSNELQRFQIANRGEEGRVDFKYGRAGATPTKAISIGAGTGDISFYEDTGTTAKLFWDASAEALGIGTVSPSVYGGLTLQQESNSSSKGLAIVDSTAAQSVKVWVDGTNSYVSSGNSGADPLILNTGGGSVGIGTSSPAAQFETNSSGFGHRIEGVSANNYSIHRFITDTSDADKFIIGYGASHSSAPHQIALKANNAAGTIGLYTDGSERLRIQSSGITQIESKIMMGILGSSYESGERDIFEGFAGGATHFSKMSARNVADTSDVFKIRVGGNDKIKFLANGNGYWDGAADNGAADYAEYFEWDDGNTSNDDRVGYPVILTNGNKIRKATSDDAASDIIGIVSGRPAFVGDSASLGWAGKWQTDDYARRLQSDVVYHEWTDSDGKQYAYRADELPDDVTVPSDATTTTRQEDTLSDSYDSSLTYIPRSERQEWDAVGMMGKLRMRAGQPTGDRWIKMRDIATDDDGNVTIEEWLVR